MKTASASLVSKYHILAPSSMDPKRDQTPWSSSARSASPRRRPSSPMKCFHHLALRSRTATCTPRRCLIVATDHSCGVVPRRHERPSYYSCYRCSTREDSERTTSCCSASTQATRTSGGLPRPPSTRRLLLIRAWPHCYGVDSSWMKKRHTTFNARPTYNRSSTRPWLLMKGTPNINVDRNPRTSYCIAPRDFELVDTGRDNTAEDDTEARCFPPSSSRRTARRAAATLRLPRRRV